MTLSPDGRVVLTDALRPPAGHRVDIVVGTTYSLNLTSLLLAPLSFAVSDGVQSDDLDGVDPIRLLEAVRRYADRTTVFCQAGGIHVPGEYRRILTFVEDSVLEVMPPAHARLFHPKIWALRFVDAEGAYRHRVVILSRNMTLDSSWDTALILDEEDDGTMDAAPAADFVAGLPALALRPVPPERLADITELCGTLRTARLAAPAPFDGGELLPIGLDDAPVWPFPDRARRLLAISPFLTAPAVQALARMTGERTLVSRGESLEMVGAHTLERWRTRVLQPLAETPAGADVSEASPALDEFQGTSRGLHAKTFVCDLDGRRSMVVTGSANLTDERWGRSVEFDAVLYGPTRECGVARVLDGSATANGLGTILQDYTVTSCEGVRDAAVQTSRGIEEFHRRLAGDGVHLHVEATDEQRVTATLSLTVSQHPLGATRVWISSLPAETSALPLAPQLQWSLAAESLTPFICVETTAGTGDARATRRCVLKADLTGDVDERRLDAVFAMLTSRADVLRYLVFLLGDPSYDALLAQLAGSRREGAAHTGTRTAGIALFEPLVRAMGRDDEALARVASLVDELRARPDGATLVPDGFASLWDAVWSVHVERAHA